MEQLLYRFFQAKKVFESYIEGDIIKGFSYYQDQGKVEIITCPATHIILPFYIQYPEIIRAQIHMAIRQFERVFWKETIGHVVA